MVPVLVTRAVTLLAAELDLRHLAGDAEGHQTVAVHVERVGGGAAQDDVAELGCDDTGVANLRRHQGSQARLADGDAARVADGGARMRRGAEHQPAGHEIGIRDAGGGDHQP